MQTHCPVKSKCAVDPASGKEGGKRKNRLPVRAARDTKRANPPLQWPILEAAAQFNQRRAACPAAQVAKETAGHVS